MSGGGGGAVRVGPPDATRVVRNALRQAAFSFLTGIGAVTRFTPAFHDAEYMETGMKAKRTTSVQSIERGLTILEALSGEAGGLGVAQLARHTGLPASTVHRMLGVFVRRGYVQRAGARCTYRIDPRFLGLGLLPVHLFREIHRLVAERFLERFAAGELGAVFVKIGNRSLSVRPGRSGEGSGTWLVPEVSDASDRDCPWGEEPADPTRCAAPSRGSARALVRVRGGVPVDCTCVAMPRRSPEGRIDRIGARWARPNGSGGILALSKELAALGGEMTRMMSRESAGAGDGNGRSLVDAEVPR